MNAEWHLNWSHGTATVNSLGGMIGPVNFSLPDSRTVQPFSIFPWCDEPLGADEKERSPLLGGARGDWFCAPFGMARPTSQSLMGEWRHLHKAENKSRAHGVSAHSQWRLVDRGDSYLDITFDGFTEGPIKSIRRLITAVKDAPTINCEIQMNVRESCRLPVGLHPTLRLPMTPGSLILKPGQFRFGTTFPGMFEQASPIFNSDKRFNVLTAVPSRDGGVIDASRLPFPRPVDDIVQLCEIDGHFGVENHEDGYKFELKWDPKKLPSCIIWICSGGRIRSPWSGRYFAVGIDPICSAFDLGAVISRAENPLTKAGVKTAVELEPTKTWSVKYQFGVKPL
jgi:hypothetical protein